MTNEQFIRTLVAVFRSQIECEAMKAENANRASRGESPAYDEEAFMGIIHHNKISDDDMKTAFGDEEEVTPKKHRPRVSFRRRNNSYEGIFLGWGKDCQSHVNGMAEYTCALVLLDDGSIATIKADQVMFLDKYE